ncbi:cell wall hydrolase [Sphingomonas xanthus]|uniref:Cell wall hydrolase n=1 Tax=Sphingomonas xanthus TaxID=2594473 RepID=A0A516ITQ5_9SPHN|nr:cell wall hydrolase [Sphingomonas xanthus]QDP20288.1 cell wall hydrolase [Sphingomonas xanthus]
MSNLVSFQPLRPWRTHPRETIGIVVLATIGLLAVAGSSDAALPVDGPVAAAAEGVRPLPDQIRDLPPETALQLNAAMPVATGPNPAASPFLLSASGQARARALECLTSAIYYEAGQESSDGQRAVAQVVLNRVRHPAFPDSVCGVVYEGSTRQTGCQFTFTCDGSLNRGAVAPLWLRAQKVAEEMLAGRVFAPVGHATHYHANYVVPYWASSLAKTAVEGAHIFYRWQGNWGRPAAFNDRWSGREGDPAALRLAALRTPRARAALPVAAPAVEQLAQAGARVTSEANGRVRVRFTPEAREAVEKVKVTPYVERVAASDNLRFALGGGTAEADRPLGRPADLAPSMPVASNAR